MFQNVRIYHHYSHFCSHSCYHGYNINICIPDHQFNEYIAVPTIRPLILVLPLLGDRRTTIGGVLFRTKQKRYTNFTSNQKFINVVKKDSCTHY